MGRRVLPFLILSFGILSCDVRDKGTIAVPDQFTTLAPRLVMANGTPVDTVDSVRVEVSFGGRSVVRSAPFSAGSVKIDSIPVGVKWSMAVKGLRKAADGCELIYHVAGLVAHEGRRIRNVAAVEQFLLIVQNPFHLVLAIARCIARAKSSLPVPESP